MKIRNIVLFMLLGLCVIQLIRLYVENRYLQHIMPGRKAGRVRRVLGGHSEDSSGRYLVHRFYKSEGFGLNDIKPKDITLVTHCTTERLHRLIGLTETWAGPMSISIFAPGNDAAFADDAIDGLRLCWPALRVTTTFHIVYPRGKRTEANMTGVGDFAYLSCKDIMRRLMLRKQSDNPLYPKYGSEVDEGPRYPHNVMRNVALSGALTDFVMAVDIEMIPSNDLRSLFLEFAENENIFKKTTHDKSKTTSNDFKSIYVLPSFENRQDEDIGGTKLEIVEAVKKGIARPMLQETCSHCHKQTDYSKWSSASIYNPSFGVAYDVSFSPGWEPFFIARRDAPWYDENMKEFGQDRLSQVCELRVKNYKFSVLNHGFLIHNAFRSKTQMKTAEAQRKKDNKKFRERFYIRLRESGRIPREGVKLC